MKFFKTNALRLILILLTSSGYCQNLTPINLNPNNTDELNHVINSSIIENFEFSGLASYLNQLAFYEVSADGIKTIDIYDSAINIQQNKWLAIAGRFNVLLIMATNGQVEIQHINNAITINTRNNSVSTYVVNKSQLKDLAPELDQIRYNHLTQPFVFFAKLSESILTEIQSITNLSWGMVIIVFAVLIKIVLLPVSLFTTKSQQKVSKITAQLQPLHQEIKRKYTGEKAHNKLMKTYKDFGVSPFYTLKPMLSFLIQIPVLIAVFNALGEMPQLMNQPFLWFDDLSQPDRFMQLGFHIPLIGSHLNLMPIIMTLISLTSSYIHKDNAASKDGNRKQKIKLYFMSVLFLLLFFPFPVAMVMYWTVSNLLQIAIQKMS